MQMYCPLALRTWGAVVQPGAVVLYISLGETWSQLNFPVVSTILARLIYLTVRGGDTGWPEPTQRRSLVAFSSPDTLGGYLSKSWPFLSRQGWELGAVCLFLQPCGVAFAGTGDNRMGGDMWRASCDHVWPSPWQIQFAFLHIFYRTDRGLSKASFNPREGCWFYRQREGRAPCVDRAPGEQTVPVCCSSSTDLSRIFLTIKTCSWILCQPRKILSSLLSLPAKAKHVDGIVAQELEVISLVSEGRWKTFKLFGQNTIF